MEAVWAAAAAAMRDVLTQTGLAGDVAAVAVAGQGDGAWMIDAQGQPVAPAPLWSDGRATAAIERWAASGALSRLYERGGTVLRPGSQAALLAWYQEHEPELLSRVDTVFCSKDWIRYRLTDTIGTDQTDGSIPFMDLTKRAISKEQFELAGLASHAHRLPPVGTSTDVVGSVTAAAAAATGLRSGTPVVAGLLDVTANAVGVGAINGGQAFVTLGTTALSAVVLDRPVFEPPDVGASVCHAPPGRWLRAFGAMAGTPNLDWYLATMGEGICAEAESNVRDSYAQLETEVATSSAGAGGVIYHPFLLGERVPFLEPKARGSFFGLSMATTRADVARAVSEGIAFAIRHCFESIGQPVTEVRLSGGGARSHVWSQILADVTGATMSVPSGSQFGALGAAITAGVGIGLYADYEAAVRRCVRVERVYQPTMEHRAIYDERFQLYVDLIDAMQPYWPRLTWSSRPERSPPVHSA